MRKLYSGHFLCLLILLSSVTAFSQPVINSFSPTIASPGDTITITGTNFLNASAVKFGTVAAQWFSVVNAGTIKALPGNGESGGITVQTPTGTATLTGFSYLQRPVIYSISPSTSYEGQIAYIDGIHLGIFNQQPVVTLGGVPVTYVSVNSNFTSIQVRIGNGASGNVKVSHPGGADSMSGFVFIPKPVITSFSPASAKPADTVYIRGTGLTGVTGAYFGDSLAASFTIENDSLIKAVLSHGKTGSIRVIKISGTSAKTGFTFLPLPPPVVSSFTPQYGISGTTLTIQGQYLWGVISVKVGNTPARQYWQNNFTTMHAIAPIAASGPVTVTTYYGTFTLASPVFTRILPPVINNISPAAAAPGQLISITGQGFGTNPQDVTVYFGPVKASVQSVTDVTLQVLTPVSAALGPIAVTVNNLTAYSAANFDPVNPAIAYLPIDNGSFEKVNPINSGTNPTDRLTIPIEINGDGKPDYVTLGQYGELTSFINTSTPGHPSWITHYEPGQFYQSYSASVADLDGDGRKDMLFWPGGGLMMNKSTADTVRFDYDESYYMVRAFLFDMNGDGKTDIVDKSESGLVKIFLNNSLPGKLNFSDTLLLTPNTNVYSELANITDFDKDGLPDIVTLNSSDVLVFRNNGSRELPAFDSVPLALTITGQTFDYLYDPEIVISMDMNGDGLLDLLVSHNAYNTASFAVYKNISTPGNIRFAPFQLIKNVRVYGGFGVSDFNGDNKPDVFAGDTYSETVLENRSTADSIILAPRLRLAGGTGAGAASDIDGDNKTDFVCPAYGLHILRNRMNEPRLTKLCPGSNLTLPATLPGSSFQWQMKITGGVYENINDGSFFTGTQTDSLRINNIPADWLKREFHCLVSNSNYSEPYTIQFENTWTGATDSDWSKPSNWSCGVVPDGNMDVVIPAWKTVVLSADGSCRSISIGGYSTFTVAPGIVLNVTNR